MASLIKLWFVSPFSSFFEEKHWALEQEGCGGERWDWKVPPKIAQTNIFTSNNSKEKNLTEK